ncbi:coiled-coil domain-containing protein 158-like [Pholidichthys leucotaenia]
MTLHELSNELDRLMKETERLQDEVENATRAALERFAGRHGNDRSPGKSGNYSGYSVYDSPEDSIIAFTHHQAVTQPVVLGVEGFSQQTAQSDIDSLGNKALKLDKCCQQQSEKVLKKTYNEPERATSCLQKANVGLQFELNKVQMGNSALSDLRLKDSKKHVDQMEKMLSMLEELCEVKRSRDQRLQETEGESLTLNRKIETLEQTIKDLYQTLFEKQSGEIYISSTKNVDGSALQSSAIKVNENHNEKREKQQETHVLTEEQLQSEEDTGVNNPERMEDLIMNLGQEMAMLTHQLSSSKDDSFSISIKMALLKKLIERKSLLHQKTIRELESTLSFHKVKVCCLEQQLFEAQREKQRSLHREQEFQSQFEQAQRCCEQQQHEHQEEVKVLRGKLEVAWEQLCRAEEEKTRLEALLEQREQEGKESQELLREKDKELQLKKQEILQHLTRLEDAQSQCQILQAEQETLRVKLNDRERELGVLRLQTETTIQMTVQHSCTIDSVQQENSLLSNQINQQKLEIQQLMAALDQHKSDLAVLEGERRQMQASVAEQSRCVQEESCEKQQLTTQLDLQQMQLLTLTKEHKDLQRLYSCKNEEHEGVVLKLQRQLRHCSDELNQMRRTLRTLEGADVHGLQVALGMQKEITSRREQVDSLQSKIHHLEENMEKLHQEKHYQNLETRRHQQELTILREEKRQLAYELDALRSKDQQLRDRISKLEAILHKMSESFANCQDFIQLQEQEYLRMKLQHALNLKELQGQNSLTRLNAPPPALYSPSAPAPSSPPSPRLVSSTEIKPEMQLKRPACKLRAPIKELQGVISENHRPHTDNSAAGSTYHRRRSAPERMHKTAFTDKDEEGKADAGLRRKTYGSEPLFLMSADSSGKIIRKSSSQSRQSPVHELLTSDPSR